MLWPQSKQLSYKEIGTEKLVFTIMSCAIKIELYNKKGHQQKLWDVNFFSYSIVWKWYH